MMLNHATQYPYFHIIVLRESAGDAVTTTNHKGCIFFSVENIKNGNYILPQHPELHINNSEIHHIYYSIIKMSFLILS